MSKWRPIETAPDHGEFLGYDSVARKMDVCEKRDYGGRMGAVVTQVQEDGEYGALEGEFGYSDKNITHWRPLPDPPA